MNCFFYIFLALLAVIPYNISAQPFNQDTGNPNLDFSQGTFDHWQLSWGSRGTPYTNNGTVPAANSHTIINIYGNNWDGNAGSGNLKRVPDGLVSTARLGAPAGGGYGSPKSYAMQYPVTVNAAYPILFFRLASVMDISHSNSENTHYKFSIKNTAGEYLLPQPCGGIELTPKGRAATTENVMTSPPLPYSTLPEVGSIMYQPWESIALDLSTYAGQTILLSFEHNDCYTGHHGSYTYLSAAMRTATDTVYFCRGASETIIQPYLPGFKSYLWNTGVSTNHLAISNPTDGDIYTCTVSSYNGCSVSFSYVLKETHPQADFSSVTGGVCNQVRFIDHSTSHTGGIQNWNWSFGDPAAGNANSNNSSNPVHTYPTAGDYHVTLIIQDSSGCYDTIIRSVHLPEGGTVDFSYLSACSGSPIQFSDASTETIISRQWDFGDSKQSSEKNPVHTYTIPGTYTITQQVIYSNGCSDSAQQEIQVYPKPTADFSATPQITTLSSPVTFTNQSSGATNWQWSFGDGHHSQEENPVYRYTATGKYPVTLSVVNEHQCRDSAEILITLLEDFVIPNVFTPDGDGINDVLTISLDTSFFLGFELIIINRWGEEVFHTKNPLEGWDGTSNGNPVAEGVYFYTLQFGTGTSNQKHNGFLTLAK